MEMLVDTGASVSILRPDIVKNLKLIVEPSLFTHLTTAGKDKLRVQGECFPNLKVGNTRTRHRFLIADVRDKGIIGLDTLQRLKATLDLSNEELHLPGRDIPLHRRFQCVSRSLQINLLPKEDDWAPELLKSSNLVPGSTDYIAACKVFNQFRSVFAAKGTILGKTHVVEHSINTGDAQPIKQPPRRLPLASRDHVNKLVQEMLDEGVIEPSKSPWASPVVLVPKKDGTTRFCIDYRKLNKVTKKDSYALPTVQALLDALEGSSWFCTLDLKSGYWQIKMKEEDKEKTAFAVDRQGLWQFKVMPFGLSNAPATFQRLMEAVIPADLALVYLDDVIIHGPDIQTVLSKLSQVLERFKKANLQVNAKKCSFFTQKVQYLGHIISADGIQTDPKKTDAVKNWPVPKSKRDLRSFLGFCSYYRRFVPDFAKTARPLHALTEDRAVFHWDKFCDDSFQKLKALMMSAPILAFPDLQKPFVLDCDASGHAVGAVLSQVNEGVEKVVAYYSQALTQQERNYCATRRELLAAVKSIQHFHYYLYGQQFTLRTDHSALKWLSSFQRPEGQMARWLESLQMYSFNIVHRPGKSHGNADGLSRQICYNNCSYCTRVGKKGFINALRLSTIDENCQLEDASIQRVIEWRKANVHPDSTDVTADDPQVHRLLLRWDSLEVQDGKLFHRWVSGKGTHLQLVIPTFMISQVLERCHDQPTGGHFGFWKTLAKARQSYFWPGMSGDVKAWCHSCQSCQQIKTHRSPPAPLQQCPVGAPFDRMGVDILGRLPETKSGNKYVLVATDYFTKWPEAIAIPNQEAETVAKALVKHVFSRTGVPHEIHTDQGRNFEADLMREIAQLMGSKRTRATPLHPQSCGQVERLNHTLTKYLAAYIGQQQDDWDEKIPLFLLAYRSAPHKTTGFSPAQLVYGRDLHLPEDLYRPSATPQVLTTPYAFQLRADMEKMRVFARDTMKINMRRQKDWFDRRSKQRIFNMGDWVWVHDPKRLRGRCPKLEPQWTGPWVVTKKINDVTMEVKMGRKKRLLHVNRMAHADVRPQMEPGKTGG